MHAFAHVTLLELGPSVALFLAGVLTGFVLARRGAAARVVRER